jgi:fibronectin type 3 domain-containing protein
MKKIAYILFFSFIAVLGQAQETEKTVARVFVENNYKSGENGILIKWLARKVYYKEGVNIYRKSKGSDWKKINNSPIKINTNASLSELGNDAEALNFMEAIGKLSYDEFQESFFRAFVLIKDILNTDFALVAGAAFLDKDVLIDASYEYKLMSIEKGVEKEIALSTPITAAEYKTPEAIKSPLVNLNFFDKAYEIKWEVEELRYYGVMVHRSTNGGAFIPIHKAPIAAQKIQTDSGKVYPEYFFKDFKIGEDTSYSYKLVGIDYFGQETEFSQIFDFPARDFSFPTAPIEFDLISNNKKQSIDLSWELPVKSDDAIGFKVYRLNSGDSIPQLRSNLLPIETTSFSENVNVTGGYYYYVVCADDGGNEAKSATIFTELRDVVAPSVPIGFNILADTGKFIFKWTAAPEKDLAGYYIYRSISDEDNSNNKFMPMNSDPIDTNYFELPVSDNVRNKFAYQILSADTNFNKSVFSEIKIAQLPDVEAPKTPLVKNVSIKDSVLVIEWLPNVDSDLKGYNIYRKVAEDTSEFKQLNFQLLPTTSTSYSDKQAESGIKYSYCIKAIDESGLQSNYSNVFKGKLAEAIPNIKPSNLQVKVNHKKKLAKITWTASEEEEMNVGYTVYRKNGKSAIQPISGLLTDTKFTDSGLLKGEQYTYEIRAYSKMGDVLKSEQKTIEIKLTEN